jgi:flagellar assembly factor FliW
LPQLNRLKRPPIDSWPFEAEIYFPKGLFGFETYQHYRLVGHQKESPLLRIHAQEHQSLSFYVVDPFLHCPSYTPPLTQTDLKDLEVVYEAKLIMLAIVDSNRRPSTMNLSAPLLINWLKKRGKQLLIPHDSEYPLI